MLNVLNGYKTYLGVIAWGMVSVMMSLKPEWMPVLQVVESLAMTLTGVGVGHKLAKMQ